MIKKINYIIFAFITIFCFKGLVLAEDRTCTYLNMHMQQIPKDDEHPDGGYSEKLADYYYINFTVSDSGIIQNNFTINFNDSAKSISNWDESYEKFGVKMSGKSYFNSNKKCAPYVVSIGGGIFAVDNDNLESVENYAKSHGLIYMVLDLYSSKYTINFHSNSNMATGVMDPISVDHKTNFSTSLYLPENRFQLSGYTPRGWMVQSGGKWLCRLSDGSVKYSSSCDENSRFIWGLNGSFSVPVVPNSSTVNLYMKWQLQTNSSGNINPSAVLNLNENDCKAKGYVWNKDGYCNTDNLKYVMCGDSYDIPSQVPSLLSFAVNLLKIATPIILIIISIITLVKAIASTKEDEIKKAQKSLIRKVIAAVLVFFVISIVQFVILKVADDSDHKSMTACLTCFLNNDCDTVEYYKTNILGDYYCTTVGSNNSELCDNFYKNSNK